MAQEYPSIHCSLGRVARGLKIRDKELKSDVNKNLCISCYYKFSEGLGSIGYFTSEDLLLAALKVDYFFGIKEH